MNSVVFNKYMQSVWLLFEQDKTLLESIMKDIIRVDSADDLNNISGPDILLEKEGFVLGIEHFEFDSSKLRKKSSSHREEESRVSRDFNKYIENKQNDKQILRDELLTSNSVEYYIGNLARNFDIHYSKIDSYYKNINERYHPKSNVLAFFIEDSSPLGNYIDYKGSIELVNLLYVNEFRDMINSKKDISKIEYIFFARKADNRMFFASVDEYLRAKKLPDQYNLKEYQLINKNGPQVISFSQRFYK